MTNQVEGAEVFQCNWLVEKEVAFEGHELKPFDWVTPKPKVSLHLQIASAWHPDWLSGILCGELSFGSTWQRSLTVRVSIEPLLGLRSILGSRWDRGSLGRLRLT